MWRYARQRVEAAVRWQHPHWEERQVQREVARRMLDGFRLNCLNSFWTCWQGKSFDTPSSVHTRAWRGSEKHLRDITGILKNARPAGQP